MGSVDISMIKVTFGEAWAKGGSLMWVLAFFSVLEMTMILYLWFSQRRGGFLNDALARMKAAKDRQAEGSRIASRLYSSVDWLADIAAIAPLVGLLGTVLGMFQAFAGIDTAAGAKPAALAQGVSKAIITTIFGLAVAIPALVFHALFRRRAANRIAELEEKADEIFG